MTIEFLRGRAVRCRQLRRAVTDMGVAAGLLALAIELDDHADALEDQLEPALVQGRA